MTTITADLVSGTRVEITDGHHRWTADEPVADGGTDEGPAPYDMLLGSVAACTAITVAYYAGRKGWTIDSISARYTYDRVHADDCAECSEGPGEWLHRVRSEIFIEGDFDDEQRVRLAEVATRCPVHRTLEGGIEFFDEVHVG